DPTATPTLKSDVHATGREVVRRVGLSLPQVEQRGAPVLLVGRIHLPPEPQSWFLMQPRNWLLEHLPPICAAPKTVTQMARSARPSRLVSISAQESPGLFPDQTRSSSCHLRDAVVEEEEQAGPGSHHSLRSF